MHTLGEARRVSPPSDAVARDARETLALLSQLPPQYAEPLILQATQGLSQRQIAALLDVPETTVETRLARGRRMFRNLSEETHGRVAAARSMSSDRRTSHDA
jgi:DNA-directed RNA polymerase specialized sigma24 family protein